LSFGHHPPSCFIFKTQHFGDWIPSPSSGKSFLSWAQSIALDTADYKPVKWLRYIDDTFMVWPHGLARGQQFLHHLKSLRLTIKFTMEVEVNDTHPFFGHEEES
jgi:hypothetical protein